MHQIRELFSTRRDITRRIEKVIDYNATDEARLEREVSEYEVTPSVERGFRRFLEAFDQGVRVGDVTDIGVWVSGFYGSGKSSFTKYLGFALDPSRTVKGRPFVEFLADRIGAGDVRQLLLGLAKREPTAVFMLDLGTDQMAEAAHVSVMNIVYWNVLRKLGFARERKVADLELRLDEEGRLIEFEAEYARRFPNLPKWATIHNDPALAVPCASQLVPKFYPGVYRDESTFENVQYEPIEDVKEVATRIVNLVRRRTKRKNILFLVDEVGQYVAPRKDLILNLDGFVRQLKEVGGGHVWFVATAQQTLTEISEKAAINSTDLFKLKDRFPLSIELEATDIRDITASRLLTKTAAGLTRLKADFARHRELLELHSRLEGWPGAHEPLDATTFARLYPLLPTRFDLVLDLIRALARRTGGAGLRSAIRLVQDLLVDASKGLPKGLKPVAQRDVGTLVALDDLYDTLRVDIAKEHPQAVAAVERVSRHAAFQDDLLAIRVAKAVAALQPLESRARTAENIAALLYRSLGDAGSTEAVREMLHRLVDAREFGLVEVRADADSAAGAGFLYLSDEVQPIQKKRDGYDPTQAEINRRRIEVLKGIFEPIPETRVENAKKVLAGVRLGKSQIAGESNDVVFRLEDVDPSGFEARILALEADTQRRDDFQNAVFWVFERPEEVEEHLTDVCRSAYIQSEATRSSKDSDKGTSTEVTRYVRSEERRGDLAAQSAKGAYQHALQKGVLVFRGRKRTAHELGNSVQISATTFLGEVARDVFRHFALIKKDANGDVAARFLEVDRLDRMPAASDPLGLVSKKGGRASIDTSHPAAVEAIRAFRARVAAEGTGRVRGSELLELFNGPPYGWSKDTTRYLFAALLLAGEIEIHSGDGVLRTAGPKAIEAFRNTQNFNRIGVAPRGQPVPIEALDRASRRLEEMFGVEVLPLEDQVSRVVRAHFPTVMERTGSLPDRLRLLELPGEPRARAFLQTCADLLKEDAGGAAAILGSVESTLPAEEKWASGVVKTLDSGGEDDLRKAHLVLDRIRELSELFVALAELLGGNAATTITEILRSESFYQRMADLRDAQRSLEQAVRRLYRDERGKLVAALEEARKRIESRPSWRQVPEDEREEMRAELVVASFPEEPKDAIGALHRVLNRRLGLADLEERIGRRTDQRAAAREAETTRREVSAPRLDNEEVSVAGLAPAPELVLAGDLIPEVVLTRVEEVDPWIEEVRARVSERVQAGPIRITRGR
jgi:hypothetical protein